MFNAASSGLGHSQKTQDNPLVKSHTMKPGGSLFGSNSGASSSYIGANNSSRNRPQIPVNVPEAAGAAAAKNGISKKV